MEYLEEKTAKSSAAVEKAKKRFSVLLLTVILAGLIGVIVFIALAIFD